MPDELRYDPTHGGPMPTRAERDAQLDRLAQAARDPEQEAMRALAPDDPKRVAWVAKRRAAKVQS